MPSFSRIGEYHKYPQNYMPRNICNGFAWEMIYDIKIVKNLYNQKKKKIKLV